MSTLTESPLPPPGPPERLMTAEEFLARYWDHGKELVRGVVRDVAMPMLRHGIVSGRFARHLFLHLMANDIGQVLINDTFLFTRRNPDCVRGMDIAFISYGRLPKGEAPDGPLQVPPELVVEVRSPTDLWTEVFAKVGEYHEAGVNVVIVLDPEKKVASVHRPPTDQTLLGVGDTLTLPDVLPGFSVEVARLFD